MHLDAVLAQVLDEHLLGYRLRHKEQIGMGGVLHPQVEQRQGGDLPAAGVQGQPRSSSAPRQQRAGKREGVEHLEGAGLHGERPGFVRPVGVRVDDARPGAVPKQARREGETGRSRTHHQHIDVRHRTIRKQQGLCLADDLSHLDTTG